MKIIITESQLKLITEDTLSDDEGFKNLVKGWEGKVIDPVTKKHITYDDVTMKPVTSPKQIQGTMTIGYGTTRSIYPQMKVGERISDGRANQLLELGIKKVENEVRRLIPKYDQFPRYVRMALLNAKYRADLGPATIKLINQNKWSIVSKEYLDHSNYKNPGKYPGVVKRMKSNADAFDRYAKELKGVKSPVVKKPVVKTSETEKQRCLRMEPLEAAKRPECDKYFKSNYHMNYGYDFSKDFYVVKPGDTLSGIAAKHGKNLTVDKLKKLNNLKSDTIRPGQKIKLR
jgi:GH24 family phage-related lysozyme (muramidase)